MHIQTHHNPSRNIKKSIIDTTTNQINKQQRPHKFSGKKPKDYCKKTTNRRTYFLIKYLKWYNNKNKVAYKRRLLRNNTQINQLAKN